MAKIYVKRIDTDEVVHSVDVGNKSPNMVDKVVHGMLINMDRDNYYVDDNEVEEVV